MALSANEEKNNRKTFIDKIWILCALYVLFMSLASHIPVCVMNCPTCGCF